MRKSTCIAVLALALSVARPATAQSHAIGADLIGVVVDESGAVLPGVTITAQNVETGMARTTTTGHDGRFVMPALAVGSYAVEAEAPGFAPQVLEPVVATLGATLDIRMALKVGGARET